MAQQKNLVKGKRKNWVPILGTRHFNNVEVGETLVSEPSSLIGKNICLNLSNLNNDSKSQNVRITFKIKEIKDSRAFTELVKYEIVPTSLKRMVHKGKEKIDDSFELKTKDNIKIRIKPFIVTRSSTKRSVLTALRKKTQEILIEQLKKFDYENLIENLIRFRLQSHLKRELKKTYPLAQFQIRKLEKLVS